MIIIKARRWFDRTYGNTYHSVQVFDDAKLIGEIPFEYGYGDSYIQTAFEILSAAGYYPYKKTDAQKDIYSKTGKYLYSTPIESLNKQEAYYNFKDDMRNHRDRFLVFVDDVARKKDL